MWMCGSKNNIKTNKCKSVAAKTKVTSSNTLVASKHKKCISQRDPCNETKLWTDQKTKTKIPKCNLMLHEFICLLNFMGANVLFFVQTNNKRKLLHRTIAVHFIANAYFRDENRRFVSLFPCVFWFVLFRHLFSSFVAEKMCTQSSECNE